MPATINQKIFAPFAFLLGKPMDPNTVPFTATAPDGLALVFSAPTPDATKVLP